MERAPNLLWPWHPAYASDIHFLHPFNALSLCVDESKIEVISLVTSVQVSVGSPEAVTWGKAMLDFYQMFDDDDDRMGRTVGWGIEKLK